MSNDKQINPRDKSKIFIKNALFWLLGVYSVLELTRYNKRLERCSKIVSVKKLKIDNFKLQKKRIIKVIILTIAPVLLSLVYHWLKMKDPNNSLTYHGLFKEVVSDGPETILKLAISSPAVVISLVTTVAAYIIMQVYFAGFVSNYEIRKKTKELYEISKRLGLIDEGSEDKCLWTSLGILMELKASTAPELIKNTSFWNQLGMEPGEIIYSKEEKRTFFVLSGFELPDELDFTIKDRNDD